MDFDKFAKARKTAYDPENDAYQPRTGGDNAPLIFHKCDIVGKITKLRFGRSDNKGNPRTYKHHYLSAEFEVVKIGYQSEFKPQLPSAAKAGEPKEPADTLELGEKRSVWIKLPKRFFEDPEEYTDQEWYMMNDCWDFLAALCGVTADAIDLSDFHDGEDGLTEDDGAPLTGIYPEITSGYVGLRYKESIQEATDKKREGAYINMYAYPVDAETLEPMKKEAVEAKTQKALAAG